MDEQPKTRGTRPWWILILLALAGGVIIYLAVPPGVSCTLARNPDATLRLEVRKNFKVNDIRDISLCVEGEMTPIWQIAFAPTPVPSATIDLHHAGAADQGQMARALRPGERFSIRVDYQFDSAIPPAACIDRQQFHFRIGADARPEYLGTSR